mmetsp:Transcript_18956/g.52895  ORF Transcript_18956/g.52895 Transcript_18956/m.52895 type:complete len:265 (+) Transcript_18956:224-1018(+)
MVIRLPHWNVYIERSTQKFNSRAIRSVCRFFSRSQIFLLQENQVVFALETKNRIVFCQTPTVWYNVSKRNIAPNAPTGFFRLDFDRFFFHFFHLFGFDWGDLGNSSCLFFVCSFRLLSCSLGSKLTSSFLLPSKSFCLLLCYSLGFFFRSPGVFSCTLSCKLGSEFFFLSLEFQFFKLELFFFFGSPIGKGIFVLIYNQMDEIFQIHILDTYRKSCQSRCHGFTRMVDAPVKDANKYTEKSQEGYHQSSGTTFSPLFAIHAATR